ncbi:hypothetical protein BH09VER1_BH09VER1_55550 [soil metagenome]
MLQSMRKLISAALFLLCATSAWAQLAPGEYIVLTGSPALMEWEKFKAAPHDKWWGNFVRASRVRIEQIRAQNPTAPITWLVYKPGYVRRSSHQDKQDLIPNILSVRDKYNLNLVWVENGQDVINYLNGGRDRNQTKIADFEYFGHSNRACFMLDYSNEIDSASKAWLHENDLKGIHRGLFTRDAHIKSWGCYTGESMSAKWKAATGKKMIGAIGKTDYALCPDNGWIPQLSPGGRWGG